MLINEDAMCKQVRSDNDTCFLTEPGKSCPDEILQTLAECNVQGRPIWKPMHLQPLYRTHDFITREGSIRVTSNDYPPKKGIDVGADIFQRGLCLPSDIKMTAAKQDRIIEIVRNCFE